MSLKFEKGNERYINNIFYKRELVIVFFHDIKNIFILFIITFLVDDLSLRFGANFGCILCINSLFPQVSFGSVDQMCLTSMG